MKISVSRYALTSLLLVVALALLSYLLGLVLPLNTEFFAFPMNLILLLLWLWGTVELYRSRECNVVSRYLLSRAATVTSVVLLAVWMVVFGLQRKPTVDSYLFVATTLFVTTQIGMVTLRGWRNGGGVRWIFTLCHVGMLFVLLSGLWGAPDMRIVRAKVGAEPSREAFMSDGRAVMLDYELSLSELNIDYYSSGVPSRYDAVVEVDGRKVSVAVNHPQRVAFCEYLYLASVDSQQQSNYCIVQIVRQPWQWMMFVGIVLLIFGAVLMFIRGPRR